MCTFRKKKSFNANVVFVCTSISPWNSYSSVTKRSDFYQGRWVLQIGSSLQGSELVQAFSFSSYVIHVTRIKLSMQ